MRQIFTLAIVALAALAAPAAAQVATDRPAVIAGAEPVRVETISVHSDFIAGNLEGNSAEREVFVLLPPSYDREPERRYPVVYALHGFWIDARQWMGEIHMPQTAEGAFASGVPEMIVVLPSSKTRHLGSFYASGQTVGNFEEFIASELVAHIDANYRTIARRESRGLVGHSMGGYGATRIGLRHADAFGALYVMSPGGLTPRGASIPAPELVERLYAIDAVEDLADLPNEVRGLLASSAALAPNPDNPPLFLDFPFDEAGVARPDIVAKLTANAPLAFIDQHIDDLQSYAAIALDVGDADFLIADAQALHTALDRYGIVHQFEIYAGDHTNRLGFRMQDHVLPFFGQHLEFGAEQ
ncbi:MAG: alpha/beta fold hydrolase [Erythrobacter sp.]|nr:MAG: alpha/beta fold hydrolase [Erythrobacter sp.]